MKKIFTSLLTFAFLAVAGTSWAQTDVTSQYIKNPGFEDATAVTANIRTYAKDKVTGTDETSGLQEVADWTAVNSQDGMAAGAFAYGNTSAFLGSDANYKAPATAPAGGGNNVLGLVAVWSFTAQYTQAATLPAGTYTLTADIYNSYGGTTAASKDLFGFITDGGNEFLASAKSYTADTWTTISVTFTLAAETSGKFSIGYISANTGTANAQHLFYDNLKLTYTSDKPEGFAFEDGIYYLYDEEAKLFFSRGCAWGTEASADKYGIPLNFKLADGAYTISPYDASSKYVNADNAVYTDQSTFNWTIAASGEGYTLATSAGKYMSHASGSLGEYVTLVDEAKVWKLLTKDEHDAIVDAYPADNISTVAKAASLDASSFETTIDNNYVSSVVKTIAPTDYTWTNVSRSNASSDSPREVYQGTGNFTYSSTDLTPGIYKVSINAFERNGSNAENVTYATAGYNTTTSYLKANDQQVRVKAWAEDRTSATSPNSVAEAKTLFDNGKYLSEVYVNVGEDGKLDLTVAVPAYKGSHWFIMGNTVVTLYQDAVTEEQSNTLIATATELVTKPMEATVKKALTDASDALGESKTDKTKYQALSDAVTAAQASVGAYAAAKTELDRRKTVVESENNVYTADAKKTYYTDPLGKYEANTLTTDEANALVESWGLREAVQTTAFLGSAFGVSNYSGVPYINTWSTEGNTDGSNFKTPFYEYWTANANALADKTLTATLTGLDAGEYAVSAWVRVRLQNDKEAPATGITLQVNDGDAVAITGTQVGDSRLYLDNYTVYGTVGSDGKLEIKFNVASTNVSWLAFQNLHYAKVESVTLDETKENGLEPLTAVAGKPAEVTFTRNFKENLNSTICLPYEATPDANAGTFYTFAGVTEENGEYVVTMSEITTTTLTANTPYLFKPAATGDVTFTGKIAKVADTYTPTDVTNGEWTFAGSYEKAQWNTESAWGDYEAVYCYSMNATETNVNDGDFVKVKKPSTGFTSTPFRCMMKYKAATSEGESVKAREMNTIPSSMKVVLINADGTSTAIDAIDVETEFADGAWYTIDGRKLQGKPAVKGIYINGGQKVLIK